jgi:hypothetical protein
MTKALINEMKAAAYQEVATFGDLVLKELARLPWELAGVRLWQQTTYTVKRFSLYSFRASAALDFLISSTTATF